MISAVLIAALLIVPSPIVFALSGDLAQEEGRTPTLATKILNRSLKAMGGREAFQKIRNRVIKGIISTQGMDLPFERYEERPNSFYQLVEIENVGRMERGSNGKVVWQINPMTGPTIMEGKERECWIRRSKFNEYLIWDEKADKAEYSGLVEVKGKTCWKVTLSAADGFERIFYIDTETYLLKRRDWTNITPDGRRVAMEEYFSDYKNTDGILFPRRILIAYEGSTGEEVVIRSLEHNAELPAGRFALPDSVKALVGDK
jgi:hypothetical protein